MARMARVMFEGVPFHVTHRGNHKKQIFFNDSDRQEYLDLLRRYATRFEMSVWGYCLMDNHVHTVAVGSTRPSISKALGNAHREFSRLRNRRVDVTGHLWANRFWSTALDEPHLWAAIRYVERNPVRADIVEDATEYAWSSARAHAFGDRDQLLAPDRPFPGPIGDWRKWLAVELDDETLKRLRDNTATGRPTGSRAFVSELERQLDRSLRRLRRKPVRQ